MNIKGTILEGNIQVDFKLDTGFGGECLLSYDTFSRIEVEEEEGPTLRLANGSYLGSRSKTLTLKILDKEVKTVCLSNPLITTNLIGELLIRRVNIVIDYKSQEVKDP
ncbi:clan AA aspartic protease [Sulfolobus sp. E11-6]|uniref:clan AA aspartic protease n=1 Tax=Sulfolobus sp. E11-6 TaxID=2663020 RepID=UPI001294F438|nr:clan AA aspartic protease [Sulfolobus sp. E11-6]QGA68927.1 clan AA aspartic protease [Sulfolobus sp. E11-6]